jgi:hypothetical protein
MGKFYSPGTLGFYDDKIHGIMPGDAIAITDDEYAEYLNSIAQGKVLKASLNGKIRVVDYTPPFNPLSWSDVRAKRNKLLAECDFTQVEDYPGDKEVWKAYRQELRDLPSAQEDPNNITWPVAPAN